MMEAPLGREPQGLRPAVVRRKAVLTERSFEGAHGSIDFLVVNREDSAERIVRRVQKMRAEPLGRGGGRSQARRGRLRAALRGCRSRARRRDRQASASCERFSGRASRGGAGPSRSESTMDFARLNGVIPPRITVANRARTRRPNPVKLARALGNFVRDAKGP